MSDIGTDDVLSKPLLLQQLEVLERGAWICQVLEVGRARPVLQVVKIGNEGRVREQLARGEVVQILRVCKRLDKLGEKSVVDQQVRKTARE